MGLPSQSLMVTRSKLAHDQRRKIWDRGFSSKGKYLPFLEIYNGEQDLTSRFLTVLRDFEQQELTYVHQLERMIAAKAGEEINISLWSYLFSIDVMGHLAFGKPFNALKMGKEHFIMQLIHEGQKVLSFFTPVPWLLRICVNIPGAAKGHQKIRKWCMEHVERRQKEVSSPTWLWSSKWCRFIFNCGAKTANVMRRLLLESLI